MLFRFSLQCFLVVVVLSHRSTAVHSRHCCTAVACCIGWGLRLLGFKQPVPFIHVASKGRLTLSFFFFSFLPVVCIDGSVSCASA